MRDTDELHRRLARPVCGFNKPGAWLNLDVGEFVEQSKIIEHSSRNNGESLLHLTGACVEHDAELRKTSAALCGGKHNAALLHNPNQGEVTAMQEDNFEYRCEY